jgi:MFS family permease
LQTDVFDAGLCIMSVLTATQEPLPRPIWVLAGAMVALFIARGMTVPFFIIYFGQVRGFGEAIAGAGIMINAVVGVVFTLLMAGLIDRVGAHPVLIATIVGVGLMTLALTTVGSVPAFFLVMALYGLAAQLFWPAADGLATSLINLRQAARMFALLRVTNAIGIGAGGLIGGLIVSGGGLPEYRLLFFVSAIGCLVAGALAAIFIRPERKVPEQDASFHDFGEASGWRAVLADRRFIASQLIIFALVAGFMQLQVAMPPYLRAEAGVSESFIGGLLALKTVLLVIFQMPVAGRIAAWRRGLTLTIAGVSWMIAYLLIGLSPWLFVLPVLAVCVFVIGEMLFMPTSAVIVVDLAPEKLRGRYLAVNAVAWGIGWGFSSLIAGVLLGSSAPWTIWLATIAVIAAGSVGGWFYDRTLPDRHGGIVPVSPVGGETYTYRQSQEIEGFDLRHPTEYDAGRAGQDS